MHLNQHRGEKGGKITSKDTEQAKTTPTLGTTPDDK